MTEDTVSRPDPTREALTPESERTLRRDIERGGPVTPGDVILLLNTLDACRRRSRSGHPMTQSDPTREPSRGTICVCGAAKSYHRPDHLNDHEYEPRYPARRRLSVGLDPRRYSKEHMTKSDPTREALTEILTIVEETSGTLASLDRAAVERIARAALAALPTTPAPSLDDADNALLNAATVRRGDRPLSSYKSLSTTPTPLDVDLELAATKVLAEFDYWTTKPRPANDGGMVRLHNFTEVQPEMERALANLAVALEAPHDPE